MCHLYNNMLRTVRRLRSVGFILINTGAQGIQFLRLAVSSRSALSAEELFLRKQLAFYQEHRIPPEAHGRSAIVLGAVVSIIQLERSVDDSEARDPNRLASQGVQGILALEVEDGKAADSRESCGLGLRRSSRPGSRFKCNCAML